jgi:predicted alpha/beta hydrolase
LSDELVALFVHSHGVCRICGATLARAHARSGDRIAIAAYLGTSDKFDRAVTDFATGYADQNERDYQALVDAVDSGRLIAESGSGPVIPSRILPHPRDVRPWARGCRGRDTW